MAVAPYRLQHVVPGVLVGRVQQLDPGLHLSVARLRLEQRDDALLNGGVLPGPVPSHQPHLVARR